MAGVSDKARFYLERAAPELREFEDKEIFTKDEIRSLVTKRSDHEHTILSPGASPSDFLAYVAWERSLDRLRTKRCARLRIHQSNSRASHARTFSIFERAVLKHPGCLPLWTAYLDFAAREAKASKRWRRIVTRAIRLHPADAGLWALAGRRAARDGDMERARAHFLRGCRFCVGEATLWIEYARCEMEWLGRVEAKKGGKGLRRGVGVMEAIQATEGGEQEGDYIEVGGDDDEDSDEDLVMPDPDAPGGKTKTAVFDAEATRKLEQSPALGGAIPMAIFDYARKQRFYGPAAAEEFFNLFAGFTGVSSHAKIVQHVLAAMEEEFPNHPATGSCQVRQPLVGIEVNTAEFPRALRESLGRLRAAMDKTEDKDALAQKMVVWLDTLLHVGGLDEGIRTVLEATKRSMEELSN
ncbi:U3 small nucleolar RNA-associated protein 6-domain-containing protein [Podospora conica]|nr:U3 small nucleolar RNA-associated protein 6-domain-containing protein [Schizothecium conicum]